MTTTLLKSADTLLSTAARRDEIIATPEMFAPAGWDADDGGDAITYIEAALAYNSARACRLKGNTTYSVSRTVNIGNNQVIFTSGGETSATIAALASFDKAANDRVVEMNGSNAELRNVTVSAYLFNDVDIIVTEDTGSAFSPVIEHVKTSGGRNGLVNRVLETHVRHCLFKDAAESGVKNEMVDLTCFDVSTDHCRYGFRSTDGQGSHTLFHFHAIKSISRGFYVDGANHGLYFGCHADSSGQDGFRMENTAAQSFSACWGFRSSHGTFGSPVYADVVTTEDSDIITSARLNFNASRHVGKTIEQTVTDGSHPALTIPAGATIIAVTDTYTAQISAPATATTTGLTAKIVEAAQNTYGDWFFDDCTGCTLTGCQDGGESYTLASFRTTGTTNTGIVVAGFYAGKAPTGNRTGFTFVNCTGALAAYNTDLPWRYDIDPIMSALASVGTWAALVDTAAIYNGSVSNATSVAINDSIDFQVTLGQGTWTLEMMHITSTNRGIYTVSIDPGDGTFVAVGSAPYSGSTSTIDGYSGSAVRNVKSTITGILIATTGKQILRFKMATKNASSSDYVASIQKITLRRTA